MLNLIKFIFKIIGMLLLGLLAILVLILFILMCKYIGLIFLALIELFCYFCSIFDETFEALYEWLTKNESIMHIICSIIFGTLSALAIYFKLIESMDYRSNTNSKSDRSNSSNINYEEDLNDTYRNSFSYVDASGAYRKYGESFIDCKGNWCSWGSGFYDHDMRYVRWGEPFVDGSGAYRNFGEPFVDGAGNWVRNVPK